MAEKILFLPIEIVARELDSKLLLAHYALDVGYRVFIGPKNTVRKIALILRRGQFIYKDHSPLSRALLRSVCDNNVSVFCLDEEGFVWHSDEEYSKRIDPKVIELSEGIFLWGENQRELVVNYGTKDTSKLFVTGNPRFDLLNQKYRSYLDHNESLKDADVSGFVLINSMFAAGNWNPFTYGTKTYVNHQQSRGKIKTKRDLAFYEGKAAYYSQLLEAYRAGLIRLSREFPDAQFVLRPHPDENHDHWRKILAGLSNVKVIYSGSSGVWINRAKVLIYTGCTTGIEAWAMGKPTIRYNPLEESEYEGELPNKFGVYADTEERLIEEVRKVLEGSVLSKMKLDPSFVTAHIKNAYSSDAAEKIVKILNSSYVEYSAALSGFGKLSEKLRMSLMIAWLPWIKEKMLFCMSIFNRKAQEVKKARGQKFPRLAIKDISDRLNSIGRIVTRSKTKKETKIKKVADSTFLFERS